jgi:hypothetical protein
MLISVHLPKTGGVSFRAVLEKAMPSGLRRDYGDAPLNTPVPERISAAFRDGLANLGADLSGVQCIHGHFLPVKYLPMASVRGGVDFVTWMRHPVDRLVSHYNYWMRRPVNAQPFRRRVVEEGWSLERFCLSQELRNLYSQFLYAFPLEYFSFIGITEHYAEDLSEFTRRYLGSGGAVERLNAAPGGGTSVDAALRRRIEEFHADDMALYERALAYRAARRRS